MMYRNTVRLSALSVTVALSLHIASAIAGSPTQKPADQTEASLMTAGQAIPDVDVVLKKKPPVEQVAATRPMKASKSRSKSVNASRPETPDEQSASNRKTNKDGSFSFENVPAGTYNLTFDAPKVSPAMAGKVEYLVIVQQIEAGGNSASQTYDDSKPKTARIPIGKIKDGLDFTVSPPPPGNFSQASKSKNKNSPAGADPKKGEPPPPMMSKAVNLRGKIFLVEIGTTRIVRDQSGMKAPNQR